MTRHRSGVHSTTTLGEFNDLHHSANSRFIGEERVVEQSALLCTPSFSPARKLHVFPCPTAGAVSYVLSSQERSASASESGPASVRLATCLVFRKCRCFRCPCFLTHVSGGGGGEGVRQCPFTARAHVT